MRKQLELKVVERPVEGLFTSEFWRSTAMALAWQDPAAYLVSLGMSDLGAQIDSTRGDIECASSSCVVTVVN